jgi:two-component system phosphate regulon response regulator PhoB
MPSRPPAASPTVSPDADARILVVDPDPEVRGLITSNLRDTGFEVDAVGSGAAALALADRTLPSVTVLEVVLPDLSGIEVCRRLTERAGRSVGSVVIVSARGDEYDRILGFEAGADDYVVKPFSVRELVMRVRGLARRNGQRRAATARSDETLQWHGLEIDPVQHRALANGIDLRLRPLEFRLIHHLVAHPGRVFSRSELLEDVWGAPANGSSRTVDTHVRRLRSRLGVFADAVETVPGFGYRLREHREVTSDP